MADRLLSSAGHASLSQRMMALYALPQLTHAVVTLPVALYIPAFYADELGLPLAGVGAMIAVSRIFDVITDPIIGILSDRFTTRWGRRKPWMAAGTPLIMLATWMLFVPGKDASLTYLLIWSSLLFLGYTLFDLPYKAWGAELSTDYFERSRVSAWREGFGAAGQVLFLALLMGLGMTGRHGSHQHMLVLAILVVVSLPPFVAITLSKVPERLPEQLQGQVLLGWKAMLVVLHNRPFLRTIIALILFGSGLMMQATLHKLVLTHVVGRPEWFAPMIFLETAATLLVLPLWIKLSDRIGKHRAVTVAALWVGFWSLAFPWVGPGKLEMYVALIVLRGCSFAAIFFLSNAIAADVVDYDLVASGKQRTGLFFALWGMAIKLAVALGVMFGTGLPALFGFVPNAPDHSEQSIQALMIIYGWLPSLIMVLGFPFLWNFPINLDRHKKLRVRIEERRIR